MTLEHDGERMSKDPGSWYWLFVQVNRRSMSLSHFLQRHIQPLRFQTDGFVKWIVKYSRKPAAEPYYLGNFLDIDLPFDGEAYRALPVEPEAQNEFFIQGFHDGIGRTLKSHALPADELHDLMNQFRDGGYKNRWVHRKKSFRELSLRCRVEVELTLTSFEARLIAERKGDVVLDTVIQTLKHPTPDYRFVDMKGIKIEDGKLIVYGGHVERSLFTCNIEALVS